ncbi:hypothetical protein [Aurantimonas endophytica]|uniref:DUF551 domain-containing protein n=1 Tax=Aurantimonas endophytica TaxID=1522175 RepID=A0A7W6MQW4_9HYPH|nr:hypothetical protein [Aurantimonas endophytica]MBB4004455.1 hypothetical protein [Aurantimonas endophytica]MCO6405291.1 hypothetical protein [Aurantimonas endophytica]
MRIIDDTFAPIDTAPRTGTPIIVAHEDVGAFAMRWNQAATNEMFAPGAIGMWEATDCSMTWAEAPGLGPSHWKPLGDGGLN